MLVIHKTFELTEFDFECIFYPLLKPKAKRWKHSLSSCTEGANLAWETPSAPLIQSLDL